MALTASPPSPASGEGISIYPPPLAGEGKEGLPLHYAAETSH